MKKALAIAALAATVAAGTPGAVQAFGLNGAKAASMNPRPPENYQGQWYVTPGGCSYSRAQAPGYAVHWVLILNPHHLGQASAPAHCPYRL